MIVVKCPWHAAIGLTGTHCAGAEQDVFREMVVDE